MEKLTERLAELKQDYPGESEIAYKRMFIGAVAEMLKSYGYKDWDDNVKALEFLME